MTPINLHIQGGLFVLIHQQCLLCKVQFSVDNSALQTADVLPVYHPKGHPFFLGRPGGGKGAKLSDLGVRTEILWDTKLGFNHLE